MMEIENGGVGLEEFENWVILEGKVIVPPVKAKGENETFYNFKIDHEKFKMNCTITIFDDSKEMEDDIFSSIRKDEIIKISGKLFLKKKKDKLWVQINVKNWVETTNDGKKIQHKIL